MAQRYFDKFPVITYANTEAIDITRRVAVLDKIATEPYLFYPYEITDNERADQFSARYYDDQYKSWIVYVVNKIVDPYYEWYLGEREMQEFITLKYGSYYNAQTKISHYTNNWVGQDDIGVSAYNALTAGQQKYWEPIFGSYNKIMSYKRRQVEWKTNTNEIMEYVVNTNSPSYVIDEICDIHFDQFYYGKGQIMAVSGNTVTVKHTNGYVKTGEDFDIVSTSYIYGRESEANNVFVSERTVAVNIPADEQVYWKPVTLLEEEIEKNEYNKTIRVLDSSLKQVAVDNLTDLLKE
jgi:hypothetical protein